MYAGRRLGNHFIEIDKDDGDFFYLVIHTGSRNFGKCIAEYYQDKAVEYHKSLAGKSTKDIVAEMKANGQEKMIEKVLTERSAVLTEGLSYLEGALMSSYLNDMAIAQRFAVMNRKLIAESICAFLKVSTQNQFETIHNYIDIPNGILRKGSVSAQSGEKCLIPINMRDGSLICVGKGNPDFNFSAPHGAGRLMSRTQAKKNLSLDDYKNTMAGIYSTTVNASTLDEAPGAYKPMDEIIENIKDTVEVVKQIKPIYNIKASE